MITQPRFIFIIIVSVALACNHPQSNHEEKSNIPEYSNENDNDELELESDCGFEDGIHSATIDYYNPETGHANTYLLDVEVENCEVTTIYFKNGGYLDDTHIEPGEIDEYGDATIEDDRGRTFEVHLDD